MTFKTFLTSLAGAAALALTAHGAADATTYTFDFSGPSLDSGLFGYYTTDPMISNTVSGGFVTFHQDASSMPDTGQALYYTKFGNGLGDFTVSILTDFSEVVQPSGLPTDTIGVTNVGFGGSALIAATAFYTRDGSNYVYEGFFKNGADLGNELFSPAGSEVLQTYVRTGNTVSEYASNPDGSDWTLVNSLTDAQVSAPASLSFGLNNYGGGGEEATVRFSDLTLIVPTSATPEPGAWILFVSGVAMIGETLRRRRNRATSPLAA